MRVGFGGDAAIAVEELSARVSDLTVSSLVVLVGVMAAIVTYYRWWRSILIVDPPLLVATVCAFAVASLPPFGVSSINSNTAFAFPITLEIGVDYAVQSTGAAVALWAAQQEAELWLDSIRLGVGCVSGNLTGPPT